MKPPMNDTIALYPPQLDENGKQIKDDYGRPARSRVETEARVKRSDKLIKTRSGTETQASLEISVPGDVFIAAGFPVIWVDQHGITIEAVIEVTGEVKNFSGTEVYYTKAYAV